MVPLSSTFLNNEVVFWADSSSVLVAFFFYKTLSLTKVEDFGGFTTFAYVALGALEDFLNGEFRQSA